MQVPIRVVTLQVKFTHLLQNVTKKNSTWLLIQSSWSDVVNPSFATERAQASVRKDEQVRTATQTYWFRFYLKG